MESTTDSKLQKFIQELTQTISHNEELFKHTMSNIGHYWQKLEDAVSKIEGHQSTVKSVYQKLVNELKEDLRKVRERIHNFIPTRTEL